MAVEKKGIEMSKLVDEEAEAVVEDHANLGHYFSAITCMSTSMLCMLDPAIAFLMFFHTYISSYFAIAIPCFFAGSILMTAFIYRPSWRLFVSWVALRLVCFAALVSALLPWILDFISARNPDSIFETWSSSASGHVSVATFEGDVYFVDSLFLDLLVPLGIVFLIIVTMNGTSALGQLFHHYFSTSKSETVDIDCINEINPSFTEEDNTEEGNQPLRSSYTMITVLLSVVLSMFVCGLWLSLTALNALPSTFVSLVTSVVSIFCFIVDVLLLYRSRSLDQLKSLSRILSVRSWNIVGISAILLYTLISCDFVSLSNYNLGCLARNDTHLVALMIFITGMMAFYLLSLILSQVVASVVLVKNSAKRLANPHQ